MRNVLREIEWPPDPILLLADTTAAMDKLAPEVQQAVSRGFERSLRCSAERA